MSMILTADRVITGDGKTVIEEGAVVLEGGRIRAVGEAEALCSRYAGETACLKGCTLMPGMIDLHTHIGYYYGLKMERRLEENRMLRALWIGRRMEETLRAGVTTIRDMSSADGIGTTLREAAACGFLRTPRILTSLKGLCITGGHGWGMKGAVEEVDGAEEIRKAVRRSIRDGADCGDDSTSYTRKVLDMKDDKGEPLFARSRSGYGDYPESVDLYRKVLSEAEDGSVTIISVGFSTNLARLLDSGADEYSSLSGKELVAKKVRMLYTMAGNMSDSTFTEYNVVIDIPAAKKVFSEWPTPLVTSPFELGAQIKFPASSIENGFAWAGPHPAVEAYKAFSQMPYDREIWDLTAVLAAVEGGPEYFTVSPRGSITVTDSGGTIFKEGNGDRAYLSVTPQQAENIKTHIVSLITSEPARYRR